MAERGEVFPDKKLVRRVFVNDHGLTLPERPQRPTTQTPLHSSTPSPSSRALMTELPSLRQGRDDEVNGGTQMKQKHCTCRSSKCLKLYCLCFASGIYCDKCNCTNCYNNFEHEAVKQEVVKETLQRNPSAFGSKIDGTKNGEEVVDMLVAGKHNKGCNCKKTGCLKKYCECFGANIPCSEKCRCTDCKNTAEDRKANPLFYQETPMDSSALPPFLSKGHSKSKCRSLLTDTIQPEDIQKLCSDLVTHSATAANIPSDRNEIDEHDTEYKSEESNLIKVKQMAKDSSKFPPSYAEKERVVLTKFRDCLIKIINLGNYKAHYYKEEKQNKNSRDEPDGHCS